MRSHQKMSGRACVSKFGKFLPKDWETSRDLNGFFGCK